MVVECAVTKEIAMKDIVTRFMVNGRKASQSDVRAVYDWLFEREESERHGHLQGISSAVFGQMNALLVKGGHLGFSRDERAAFNAWVGLPPVGAKATASAAKVNDALAALGL
jgi:hypothetical protein